MVAGNGEPFVLFLLGLLVSLLGVLKVLTAYGFVEQFLEGLYAQKFLVFSQCLAVAGVLFVAFAVLYGKGMHDFIGRFASDDVAHGLGADARFTFILYRLPYGFVDTQHGVGANFHFSQCVRLKCVARHRQRPVCCCQTGKGKGEQRREQQKEYACHAFQGLFRHKSRFFFVNDKRNPEIWRSKIPNNTFIKLTK